MSGKIFNGYYEGIKPFIVKISFAREGSIIKGEGSGFIKSGILFSNAHVLKSFLDKKVDQLVLRFYNTEIKSSAGKTEFLKVLPINYVDVEHSKRACSETYDYAALDISHLINHDFKNADLNIDFARLAEIKVGHKVIFFGYPLDADNLCFNEGMVSSLYKKGVLDIIQIDGSVNNGNSGGPLIDLNTGKIIGIVTSKQTGLKPIFEGLNNILDNDMKLLKANSATISVGGIDVFSKMKENNQNIKLLMKAIERSANVGIGYAYSLDMLIDDLNDKFMVINPKHG